MANERNKSAVVEFETMLQRHLKSGGAPVAACAGFDFDAASAYLEGALGGSQRAGYESHLAGCATCRRHLIELSRLAQVGPHTETQPVPVLDQTPAWARWKEVVAGWFDLSTRNLKWQMAGVAGAAFAILIAVIGAQFWRRTVEKDSAIFSQNTAPPASLAVADQPIPSPTPELMANNASSDVAATFDDHPQTRSRAAVPEPSVAPKDGEPNVAVALSNESSKLKSDQQGGALPPFDFNSQRQAALANAQESRQAARQDQASQPAASQESAERANNIALPQLGRVGPQQTGGSASQSQSGELAARITPPSDINPMNSKPGESGGDGKAQPDKAQQEKSVLAKAVDIAGKIILPVKGPDPKDARSLAAGGKPTPKPLPPKKPKPADDESSNPLKRHFRDKEFAFRRDINMWIDEAFKEETMQFRVQKLTRDSKDYKDVLAKEPQLKEFFDKFGRVLIVWKNKIYKVK